LDPSYLPPFYRPGDYPFASWLGVSPVMSGNSVSNKKGCQEEFIFSFSLQVLQSHCGMQGSPYRKDVLINIKFRVMMRKIECPLSFNVA
jgi:hypothetical protein